MAAEESLNQESLAELEQKMEHEWRRLQQRRMEVATATQRELERELAEERTKATEFAKDLDYKDGLLEERDKEVDQLSDLNEELKGQVLSKDVQIADLRATVNSLKHQLNLKEKEVAETQKRFQDQLRSREKELDVVRRETEAHLQKERDELETVKRQLKQRFIDMEDDLENQRRQITQSFDDAMKRRDSDWRTKTETLEANNMADELKIKQMGYEVQLLKGNLEAFEKDERIKQEEWEGKLKEAEKAKWEVESLLVLKDARLKEAELALKKLQAEGKALAEEQHRKREELSRKLMEREGQLEAQRRSFDDQMEQAEGKLLELEAKLDRMEQERRKEEWGLEDAVSSKNKEIAALKTKLDKQGKNAEMKIVDGLHEKSSELNRTKDFLKKILGERDQVKEDLDWYKRELASTGTRLAEMEKSKAQLEFDVEARVDEVRRKEIFRNEELVRTLTKQRDDVVAQLEEMRLRVTRHRVSAAGDGPDDVINVEALHHENEQLKAIVKTMRKQTEDMALQVGDGRSDFLKKPPPSEVAEGGTNVGRLIPDYVIYLENEVRRLKKDNAELEEKIQLIKGAATATRRTIPICACASEKRIVSAKANVADSELFSIVQRQKAMIEQLKSSQGVAGGRTKAKLKEAVRTIRSLVHQKHQLIEINNRLRSDFAAAALHDTPARPSGGFSISPEKAEEMQYHLTKEQLKFATSSKNLLTDDPSKTTKTDVPATTALVTTSSVVPTPSSTTKVSLFPPRTLGTRSFSGKVSIKPAAASSFTSNPLQPSSVQNSAVANTHCVPERDVSKISIQATSAPAKIFPPPRKVKQNGRTKCRTVKAGAISKTGSVPKLNPFLSSTPSQPPLITYVAPELQEEQPVEVPTSPSLPIPPMSEIVETALPLDTAVSPSRPITGLESFYSETHNDRQLNASSSLTGESSLQDVWNILDQSLQ